MAPKYILNYFNGKGAAETARLLFTVAGVEFTDNRIEGQEWQQIKPDTKRFPLSKMPTLQVDDKVLAQSQAINRYLAREFGLYGSNSMEQATIDQVCETLIEMATPFMPIIFGGFDEETKKVKFGEYFAADALKRQLTFLQNFLKANNGGTSFFVGVKISLADIAFFTLMGNFFGINPTVLDNYPELKALIDRVAANERVKKYEASCKN